MGALRKSSRSLFYLLMSSCYICSCQCIDSLSWLPWRWKYSRLSKVNTRFYFDRRILYRSELPQSRDQRPHFQCKWLDCCLQALFRVNSTWQLTGVDDSFKWE